ncbi:hypothetical protein PoMZ_09183 [Pyricularia oryzae]|uniref:Uncharacterized protein n=1 Tax=Pyricularia oryzae TaxID=318829 RepID=A0A4P7N123_PYROR|nr:hypothetical protein PoMZ_09183 [Pyricularia oryzae]
MRQFGKSPDRNSAITPIKVFKIIEWSIIKTYIDFERCVGLWFFKDEARTIQNLYRPDPRLPTLYCDRYVNHNGVNLIEKHVAKFGRSADTSSATAL